MPNTRGVFTLTYIREEKIPFTNGWISLSDVWISPSPLALPLAGYFGGGFLSPAPRSTMDKVTYASDTTAAVPGANLSVARNSLGATGSSTAGYFAGGNSSGPIHSTTDKVTYSTDTRSTIPGASLSSPRYGSGATGNSIAGYFGGGSEPAYVTTMDKITYSTDTRSTVPGAALSAARYYLAATGSSSAGYFGGGTQNVVPQPIYSIMDKLTYSSDTAAAVPGAFLSDARFSLAATGSSTAGYFGGGTSSGGARSIIDKVTYASDTTAVIPGTFLSADRYNLAATGNSTAGYFGGGNSSPGFPIPVRSTMDKVSYSTDTRTTVAGASLSVARVNLAASSAFFFAPSDPPTRFTDATPAPDTGYFGGGSGGGFHTTMDKVTYASGSRRSRREAIE